MIFDRQNYGQIRGLEGGLGYGVAHILQRRRLRNGRTHSITHQKRDGIHLRDFHGSVRDQRLAIGAVPAIELDAATAAEQHLSGRSARDPEMFNLSIDFHINDRAIVLHGHEVLDGVELGSWHDCFYDLP